MFLVRAFLISPKLLIGWIGKNVVILLVLGTSWLLRPQIAGWLAGGLWIAFVLVPTFLQRMVVRASIQQRSDRARRWAGLVRLLHPFDGFWEQYDLYRGLDAAQKGRIDEAAAIFDRLRATRSTMSRVAAMHYYRVTEKWDAFAEWTRGLAKDGALAKNPSLLVHYLRALGEIGQIEELVRTHRQFQSAILPPAVRLTVLAFGGRRDGVDRLLATALIQLPDNVKAFWRATAEFAAGNPARARELLEPLLSDPDATVRSQAKYRLEHPPQPAAEALSLEAQAILQSAETASQEEERYRPAFGGLARRAYVTWGLIAASVVMFVVEVLAGGSTDEATLVKLGAVSVPLVVQGEIWRLLASTFLHYGFLHLALNMVGLYLFGPFVERFLGGWRYLTVYLLAGSGAAGAVVLREMLRGSGALLVGASGGIMGLVGATAYPMLRGWVSDRSRPARAQLSRIVLILGLQTIFDVSIPEVSFMAHFCGMLFGFAFCALMSLTKRSDATAAPSTTA